LTSTSTFRAAARRKIVIPALPGLGPLRDYLTDLGLIVAAFLVAIQLRRTVPLGKFVGEGYRWHSPQLYLVLALCLAAAHALRYLTLGDGPAGPARRFWTPIGGALLGWLGLNLYLPDISDLQKGYFFVAAVALVTLVVLPGLRAEGEAAVPPLGVSLARLWASRGLLLLWVRSNVQSRYAQALLGILWIVLLPLSTAIVMSVVFSEIMRFPTGGIPFIAFYLSGLVPWGLFNQSISAGMRSIVGSLGLIGQIYFPREIIVLAALGEALVDTFFMFLTMLVVNAVVGIWPNPLYAALPLLLVLQIALVLGVMLLVSWLSVLIRDVPQLVSVALQVLFFLSPIIYPLEIVPARFQFLIALNPLTPIIQAWHDIVVYARAPRWETLVVPAALAAAVLVFGYRIFKRNEDRFADMV